MKKFYFLFILAFLPLVASADAVEIGGIYYNLTSGETNTAEVASNPNKYSGDIVIPASITYNEVIYSVTSIGAYAFQSCWDLTSVTIPNSVTTIGSYAFWGCRGLTSVTIPNRVTSIEDFAFYGCRGLTSVTIPNSVTFIRYKAFAFSGLTSLTIPNSVTSIRYEAFEGCSGLTSIKVEDGNTKYDSRDNCNAIIGTQSNALMLGCKNTVIPNSVTSIGIEAFYGCSGLTSVTIPNSVTSIDGWAFCDCSGLTSVTIPSSVTTIGENPFSGCVGLTSIKVEDGNTKFDSRDNCNAIIETQSNTLISGCKNTTIPNSVTSIGNSAFGGCSGLTSLTIPNSVTSIGDFAFGNCSGLTDVFCYSENVPNTDGGAFYNSNIANATLHVPAGSVEAYQVAEPWKNFKQIVAIGDVITIPIGGIYYNLKSGEVNTAEVTSNPNKYSGDINIPASVTFNGVTYSVTSIGSDAFGNCSGLTSVIIPNSVTSIGNYAFQFCRGLTSVTIPNSVTSIGFCAFYYCRGLTSFTIPNSVISIAHYAFGNCSGLTSVTIPNSVTSIGSSAFDSCSGLATIIVDENNTVYDSRDNCNAIIKTQSNTLISGCKNTVIPNSVTSIDISAFTYCIGLTSVTIPNSVTSINGWAFLGCSGLATIIVDENNTVYDSRDNCNAIIKTQSNTLMLGCKNTVIPNSVTSIGNSAFYYCSGLTSVTIPNSVTSIGESAFSGCSGLIDVFCYAENVPETSANAFNESNIANATLHVPAGSVEAYQAAEPWKNFKDIVAIAEETTEYDDIQLISTGKGTWCSAYDLDFTSVEGLKAYIASGYDNKTNTIWLTRVYSVPAGEGLVLKGEPNGHYQVPHADSESCYASFLVGNYGEAYQIGPTTDDYKNFVMKGGQFVGIDAGGTATVSKNRAYLQIPLRVFTGTRSVNIGYEDDGTTEIYSIENGKWKIEDNVYYNLQGQRVDNLTKGLYIKDGKKVIVR